MRRFLICAFVLVLPCASWAQIGKSAMSWKNLSTLRAGEKIQVVDTSHKKHSGAFVSFSDQSITMEDKRETERIQRLNVASVSVTGRHTVRNVLIGGAIGAGAGAGIGAASYSRQNCFCTRGERAAVFGVLGFVGGVVVGALLPAHKTIYRANP